MADAILICTQMMRALAYLKEMFVVHRDIKPENWVLSSNTTLDGLKLIDFGLARRLHPKSHELNNKQGT